MLGNKRKTSGAHVKTEEFFSLIIRYVEKINLLNFPEAIVYEMNKT